MSKVSILGELSLYAKGDLGLRYVFCFRSVQFQCFVFSSPFRWWRRQLLCDRPRRSGRKWPKLKTLTKTLTKKHSFFDSINKKQSIEKGGVDGVYSANGRVMSRIVGKSRLPHSCWDNVSAHQWPGCVGLPTHFVLFRAGFHSDDNLNMALQRPACGGGGQAEDVLCLSKPDTVATVWSGEIKQELTEC